MDALSQAIETEQKFRRSRGYVFRELATENQIFEERISSLFSDLPCSTDFFVSQLSEPISVTTKHQSKPVKIIDLFCGGGGLSLGVHNALKFFGRSPKLVAAADTDALALRLVERHFRPMVARAKSVDDLIRYEIDHSKRIADFVSEPKFLDKQLQTFVGKVDLLIGGPPCQGHSNLNNKTRRHDPRNMLYFVMPAFAVALKIPYLIIENVPSITQASEDVVEITKAILETHGYKVEDTTLNASDYGVAQSRTRHFMVARKAKPPNLRRFLEAMKVPEISFDEVCNDLPKLDERFKLLESIGNLSEENQRRIEYLHDNNIYDLPDQNRPVCHQDGHTYPSVYGRIRGDMPMTTITTGFATPGRGRFIHPHQRRVINIREAGRVQAFPDWYWEPGFEEGFKKINFQKIIGDAVPSFLAYPLIASLFADA